MTRYLLLMLALLAFGSCKQKKQITANTRTLGKLQPSSNPMPPKPVADVAETAKVEVPASPAAVPAATDSVERVRLVISFYSIGMGSDNKSILAYEDFIGTYAGEVKKTIDYEKTAWGREGETDFCLGLAELSQSEQDQFIARSREKLRDAKWVNLYENSPCRHRRAK